MFQWPRKLEKQPRLEDQPFYGDLFNLFCSESIFSSRWWGYHPVFGMIIPVYGDTMPWFWPVQNMDWWENLPETMDLTSLNIGTFPVDSPFKPCWYLPEMVNVYITNWKDPPFSSWENPLFLWSFSITLCMFTRPGIVDLWSGPVTGTLPSFVIRSASGWPDRRRQVSSRGASVKSRWPVSEAWRSWGTFGMRRVP